MGIATDEGTALDTENLLSCWGGKVLGIDGMTVARTPEANYTSTKYES
jgi:hypothetical protein